MSMRVGVRATIFGLSIGLAACGSTQPDERPTSARIRVDGTTPAPLELIVSTDFFEVQDPVTLEISQIIERADTSFITPPYDMSVDLESGSVLVNLANHEDESASVRLRVDLDSGQEPYDRSATMSEGGALRYVFLFLSVVV